MPVRAPLGLKVVVVPGAAALGASECFLALSARLYRVAIALVAARRWLIVNLMIGAYRQSQPGPGMRATPRARIPG